jgi:hypothetical protein
MRAEISHRINEYNLERVNSCSLEKTKHVATHYNSAILRTTQTFGEHVMSETDKRIKTA